MKRILFLAALTAFASLSIACTKSEEGGGGSDPAVVDPVKITMSQTKATVEPGKTITLTVTPTPAEATVGTLNWSSNKPSIATVDNGVVTGVAEGSCKITANTAKGLSASCTVTVEAAGTVVTAIKFASAEYKVDMGKTVDLSKEITIEPSTALDKDITWSSNDESVAKVSPQGVVTGALPGKTKIYATNEASGVQGYTTIVVSEGGDTGKGIAIDRCNSTTGWKTEMDCGEVTLDQKDFKTGIGSLSITTSVPAAGAKNKNAFLFKSFDEPVDAYTTEGCTRLNSNLIITFYVGDLNIFAFDVNGQFEFTSGGKQDVEETAWTWGMLNQIGGAIQKGWNTKELPLEGSSNTGGETDLSNINFIRFYHTAIASSTVFKLDQIRIYNRNK